MRNSEGRTPLPLKQDWGFKINSPFEGGQGDVKALFTNE
jgi:hypothetical protein